MAIVEEKRVTARLKDEMVWRAKCIRRLGRPEDQKRLGMGFPYRPGVKLCLERARLVTQAYKDTEGDPIVLRRAKALAKVLDNMTIYIQPQERIVGNYASDLDSLTEYCEQYCSWIDKAIEGPYKDLLSEDKDRAELHEIHKYWRNKAVHGRERDLLPEEVKSYWSYFNHGVFLWIHGAHEGCPNYDKLFRVGLNGIIKECEDRLKEIASDPSIYLNAREYLEQKRFLEAAIISLEAGVRWGKRFANLAQEMAKEEKDEGRRKELQDIAEACDWVPGNPPRTFYEAVQCYWFITLITRVIDLQSTGLGDRFDQHLYPFYKKDKQEGRITREQAQELLEFLWLKMTELGDLTPPTQAAGGGGAVMTTRLGTIGGQRRDGQDATNELSYIVLDATKAIGLTQPAFAIRLHRNTPQEFFYAVADAIRAKAGVFSFFNDEMMIPYLVSLGIPMEDARDYTTEGCMRWVIPGKPMGNRALGGNFALPRCLEYALYQGVDKLTGKQIGAQTPDPLTFGSIEDVIQAFLAQVRFFTEKLVTIGNIVDVLDEEWFPQPFLSALMDGCIEHGQDIRKYKYFVKTQFQPVGQITVANSLLAMKKLVFDDKEVSLAQLMDGLKNNWEGKEELRQKFLNVPKFGNDDDEVDLFARDMVHRMTKEQESFKNIYGSHYFCDGTGGSSYYAYSGLTGATPDGRKDRDLFNDGTCSPVIGTDKKGPTAVLKSVGKLDHTRAFTHLLNQKFMPHYLEGDNREAFVSYLKTWIDLGIHHIQFNVMDRETFLDAQQHPENYADLVVRVAGYSAYFIDLGKELQDQIIARTEQEFC